MAAAFSEWRRPGSPTRGALVWFLRDLWPGAGWGVVDASGMPKACYYALRRAMAPLFLGITDEGGNGLHLHLVNESANALEATLHVELHRQGDLRVGQARTDVTLAAHDACSIEASLLFEGFLDLSFAYRFGPALADVVHARLFRGDEPVAESFWFPAGLPSGREADVGLAAASRAHSNGDRVLDLRARRFAQFVHIDAPGFIADDNGFHLAPGQSRSIVLRRRNDAGFARGTVGALNAEATARFDLG